MMDRPFTIVSGVQTGADRAALDWAIKNGIKHGGWCSKGRRAEDGFIEWRYKLKETPSRDYSQRTEWNVRDSDGTVIFSISKRLFGGSLETAEFAQKYKKPLLHPFAASKDSAAERLGQFLEQNQIRVLNVSGPRASDEPTVAEFVTLTLNEAFIAKRTQPRNRRG